MIQWVHSDPVEHHLWYYQPLRSKCGDQFYWAAVLWGLFGRDFGGDGEGPGMREQEGEMRHRKAPCGQGEACGSSGGD